MYDCPPGCCIYCTVVYISTVVRTQHCLIVLVAYAHSWYAQTLLYIDLKGHRLKDIHFVNFSSQEQCQCQLYKKLQLESKFHMRCGTNKIVHG